MKIELNGEYTIEELKEIINKNTKQKNLPIKVSSKDYSLYIDDELIDTTPKMIELLEYLMSNSEKLCTKDEILDKIWGYDYYGNPRTVDVHIANLRKLLGKYRDSIQTVTGKGYRFVFKEGDYYD